MKNVFLDTNVIIDYLAGREPFYRDAEQLFLLAQQDKIRLFMSAVSVTTIHYYVKRIAGLQKARKSVAAISALVQILPVDQEIIDDAIGSELNDFEDAVQYFCAAKPGLIDMIVTRDKQGYTKSSLPVFSPGNAAALLSE